MGRLPRPAARSFARCGLALVALGLPSASERMYVDAETALGPAHGGEHARDPWELEGGRRASFLPTSALSLFLAFALGIGVAAALLVAYPPFHFSLGRFGGGATSTGGGNGTGNGTTPGGSGPPGNGAVNVSNNTPGSGVNTNNSSSNSTGSGGNSTGNSTGGGSGNSTGNSTGSGNSTGNGTGNGTAGSSGNGTGGAPGGPTSNSSRNATTGLPPPPHRAGPSLLASLSLLAPYAELAGLFLLLGGFAVAVFLESLYPPGRPVGHRPSFHLAGPKPRRREAVDPRRAISEALARLDWELVARLLSAPGAITDSEIRLRIVELYSQLLTSVAPGLGEIGARTPHEIEELGVSRLGLSRPTARELTWLFEEARYSSHPLGRGSLERAREALRRMLLDLRAFGGAV